MSRNIIQKVQYRITRDRKNAEYRKRLINKDFTIISQNCIGGGYLLTTWNGVFIPDHQYVHRG